MLKLTITLPNNAQVNLESDDEAIIDRILGMVMAEVTRSLPLNAPAAAGGSTPPPASGTGASAGLALNQDGNAPGSVSVGGEAPAPDFEGNGIDPHRLSALPRPSYLAAEPAGPATADLFPEANLEDQHRGDANFDGNKNGAGKTTAMRSEPSITGPAARSGIYSAMEQDYIDFCRSVNPLGDMRRVVVAAEGASRFLGMTGVDAEGLGRLFDLAGWPRASNFIHTLRNAARSKFRWLERVPGRAGHYSVTDVGRSVALGR